MMLKKQGDTFSFLDRGRQEMICPLITSGKRSLMVLPSDLPVPAIQGNKKDHLMRFLHRQTIERGNGRRTVEGLNLMKHWHSYELTGMTLLKGK